MNRTCRINRKLTHRLALLCCAVWMLCSSPAPASAPANHPLNPALIAAQWPAFWIASAKVPGGEPGVFYFRKEISIAAVPAHFWVHVSADMTLPPGLDGQLVWKEKTWQLHSGVQTLSLP